MAFMRAVHEAEGCPASESAQAAESNHARWVRKLALQRAAIFGVLFLALALVLGASFAVSTHDIESGKVRFSPPCLSQRLWGVECPTCGMTRGFCALAHGSWREALGFNRAAPVFFALTWGGLALAAWSFVRSLRQARLAATGRDE